MYDSDCANDSFLQSAVKPVSGTTRMTNVPGFRPVKEKAPDVVVVIDNSPASRVPLLLASTKTFQPDKLVSVVSLNPSAFVSLKTLPLTETGRAFTKFFVIVLPATETVPAVAVV